MGFTCASVLCHLPPRLHSFANLYCKRPLLRSYSLGQAICCLTVCNAVFTNEGLHSPMQDLHCELGILSLLQHHIAILSKSHFQLWAGYLLRNLEIADFSEQTIGHSESSASVVERTMIPWRFRLPAYEALNNCFASCWNFRQNAFIKLHNIWTSVTWSISKVNHMTQPNSKNTSQKRIYVDESQAEARFPLLG